MRYALGIEYDGTDFQGWQRLGHGRSVQAVVEQALSRVADHPVQVVCAGRTDSGVHAALQVVHFESEARRSLRAWILGANTILPASVAVLWAREVDEAFHARFSARARRYRYRILDRPVRSALRARQVAWIRSPLDPVAMHRAAQPLVGEHDFSAFRAAQCQAANARRDLHSIHVERREDEIVVEVQANAFLHHMVRNIVGSLIAVGRGEQQEDWLARLLAAGDRAVAGATAPAVGLTFLGPRYPAAHGLPAEATL